MAHRVVEKSPKKCSKHESDNGDLFDEKKTVYNTNQAAVEVTIKLKRHKSSGPKPKLSNPQVPYRKGSWGDLLSHNRAVEFQEAEKDSPAASSATKKKQMKCTLPEACHSSKSNCVKIPITEELYLETHTHFLNSQEPKKVRVPSAKFTLIKENEVLRNEIADLRREVEKIKHRNKSSKLEKVTEESVRKSFSQQPQPIPLSKRSPPKRIAETQTDARASAKFVVQPQKDPVLLDKSLEMENAALRREAMYLEAEMTKAKQDQMDYVKTIKDLYQLAEILKNENHVLTASHEEKQKIHDRLVEALSENQLLKQHMSNLLVKQDEVEDVPDDRVSRIRNVIRDVKSTIAEEIHGMEKLRRASVGAKLDSSKAYEFTVEDVSALLNDTNSSEVQRILNTRDPPPPTIPVSEDRSSTQYYGVPSSSPKGSRYRPSPRQNEMDLSPRVSTPVFSAPHKAGSAGGRHGTGDAGGNVRPRTESESSHGRKSSPGDRQLRSEQDLYRIESCQSFKPLPMDAIHDDDSISSSDYRSTTSSRSSPNPNRLSTY